MKRFLTCLFTSLLCIVLAIAISYWALSLCTIYYFGPQTDHYDGDQFFNPGAIQKQPPLAILRWQLTRNPGEWPDHVTNRFSPSPPARVDGSELRTTFIGHATVLLQTHGLNIITDPMYSERASPFESLGPKRVSDPGVAFDQLPKIDIVLVSHNHYDHLDKKTLKRLWDRDRPLILTPLGNDTIIRDDQREIAVEALDWNQSHKINSAVTISLQQVQHWSARWPWDRNRALWGGFVIETPSGNLFFCGDCGYGGGKAFKALKKKFGGFRFALLPIGAYEPRNIMEYSHMNPQEAIMALKELHAKHVMGIHFGTFRLTDEAYDAPVKQLTTTLQANQIPESTFRALQIGESWNIPR